ELVHAGGALRIRIVNHDDSAVLAEMNVALDCVGALIPREAKRCQRVFRSIEGGTAVANDLHVEPLNATRPAESRRASCILVQSRITACPYPYPCPCPCLYPCPCHP